MQHPLLGAAGEKHLLLGNEAIVRGALEAGINVVACYPGTPSSEVPDTFNRIRACGRFYLEYSTNEKVAMEVAAGAALGGALSLVTMKHVGLNVAADPLMTMTYTGLPGGLVVLSADDPGCHSSQNEQDNRTYARFAHMPCFEPASAQEAKDMTKAACILARSTGQPVLLRTTTRVNHLRGEVVFGPLAEPASIIPFKRNPRQFVPVPAVARLRHPALVTHMTAMQKVAETSEYNKQNSPQGNCTLGVLVSGISRSFLHDVLLANDWQDKVKTLELGFSWPLPEDTLLDFMRSVQTVQVIEEGEPLLENGLRALAQRNGVATTIIGKNEHLTVFGEYSTLSVYDALAPLLGGAPRKPINCPVKTSELSMRPPSLCAGCAHRSAFYAIRQIFGDEAYYSSDIGCYTLGLLPPLNAADFLICMGSSVSTGGGFAKASGKPVVAFIGDSTFFHSGLTGLANAVFNKHDLLLVILDNGTTAMTGHQPNPGVAAEVLGESCVHLDIATAVRGLGVEKLVTVRGYNQKALQREIEALKSETGVRVLLVQEPCVLFARRTLKKERTQVAYVAEQGEDALRCLNTLACQAFRRNGDTVSVDEELCSGCMVCMQVSRSFKGKKRGA